MYRGGGEGYWRRSSRARAASVVRGPFLCTGEGGGLLGEVLPGPGRQCGPWTLPVYRGGGEGYWRRSSRARAASVVRGPFLWAGEGGRVTGGGLLGEVLPGRAARVDPSCGPGEGSGPVTG